MEQREVQVCKGYSLEDSHLIEVRCWLLGLGVMTVEIERSKLIDEFYRRKLVRTC